MRTRFMVGLGVFLATTLLASDFERTASAGPIVFDGYNLTANGTTVLDGTSLQLSHSVDNPNIQYGSAFSSSPITISQSTSFMATFSFSIQNNGTQNTDEFFPFQGNGGGFSFIVQNATTGPNTLYSGFTSAGYAANSNSLGVQFNADQPNNLSPSPTAGTVTITPAPGFGSTATTNFDLQGGQPSVEAPDQVNNLVTGTVTVSYNAMQNLLTVMATNSVNQSIELTDSLNLYNIITEGAPSASPTAYFGFEAQEGGGFLGLSQTEISNYTLSVGTNAVVPEPASAVLLAIGLLGVGAMIHRRRRS